METNLLNSPNFSDYVYLKNRICDNTLDDAQLETRCPLDNGRHDCTPILSTNFAANQLDRFPVELLVEVLLLLDIPSITRFRSLNCRSMAIVNSIHQYSAIIKHCPDIIRAIVSLQADGFDCRTLYQTLSTTRCSTCSRFGDYLYLIDCRRVCYLCFTCRVEYFPLTTYEASKFFTPDANSPRKTTSRKLLQLARPPSILSLPGRYCTPWSGVFQGNHRPKRLRLYDRRAVDQDLSGAGLPSPELDKTTREPKRYMAIISAPVLLEGGRQVDHGFFCLGCEGESNELNEDGRHFRTKYTTEEMSAHIARYGVVESVSGFIGKFKHISKDRIIV